MQLKMVPWVAVTQATLQIPAVSWVSVCRNRSAEEDSNSPAALVAAPSEHPAVVVGGLSAVLGSSPRPPSCHLPTV